jgi:hypothetical protein
VALETALEIAQRAMDELGLPRPTALATSTSVQSRQLLALLNAGGREFMRVHEWGDLITLATVTTEADESDYAVEADYHRMVDETHWDRTNDRRMGGPDSPQKDRWQRESGIALGSIHRTFRQIGKTEVRIYPTPTVADETLVYEYVSRYWARSADADAKEEVTVDTDYTVFDADLMVKDLKWRFFAAKGWAAEALKAERDAALAALISADVGGKTLSLAGRRRRGDGDMTAGVTPNVILTDDGDQLLWD